jgi:peroxiredoxin family protein
MKKKNAATLEDLYQLSADMGVQIRVCSLSQELLEIPTEELVDYPGLAHCGVACFMETSAQSRTTLFI